MELLVLKMPPERASLMESALRRDLAGGAPEHQAKELAQIVAWLNYRIGKWHLAHPDIPQD